MIFPDDYESRVAKREAELVSAGVGERDARDRAHFELVIPGATPKEIAEDLEELRKMKFR